MKRIIGVILVLILATMPFAVADEGYLHYALLDKDAMVGDVHPYYHNGTLYMFYLARDGKFSSSLLTSTDFISYTPVEIATTKLNAPGSAYYVLGVIKDGSVFRSFYGDAMNIGASVSNDLITWQSGIVWDEDTYEKQYSPSSSYPAGIRDPYAFYDPDTNKYHIISTGYKAREDYEWSNTNGYDVRLVLFTTIGNSLADWEVNPITGRRAYHKTLIQFGDWVHDDVGEPECPQMFKIGNRWYVFASMAHRSNSDHSVGRLSYWIGDEDTPILEQDWSKKQEHYLTGEDLCAAQLAEIEGKYYLYGWITQYNTSGGWGGTLNLMRRVGQRDDGTLYTYFEDEFIEKIDTGLLCDAIEGKTVSLDSGKPAFGYDEYTSVAADGRYSRSLIRLNAALTEKTEAVGIMLSGKSQTEMGLRLTGTGLSEIYLKEAGKSGKVSAVYQTGLKPGDEAELTFIIEGNVAEIEANGEWVMCARAGSILSDCQAEVFSAGESVIERFTVSGLAAADGIGG